MWSIGLKNYWLNLEKTYLLVALKSNTLENIHKWIRFKILAYFFRFSVIPFTLLFVCVWVRLCSCILIAWLKVCSVSDDRWHFLGSISIWGFVTVRHRQRNDWHAAYQTQMAGAVSLLGCRQCGGEYEAQSSLRRFPLAVVTESLFDCPQISLTTNPSISHHRAGRGPTLIATRERRKQMFLKVDQIREERTTVILMH